MTAVIIATEEKTITLFIAVNECGDFHISEDGAQDAVSDLMENFGYEAVRVVTIHVTLDLPTAETVDVTLPPEAKTPAQVTVS